MSKRFPRAKWVLPQVINPSKRICFQIQVPDERFHIAAFLGCLYNLTSAIFWADDSAHTAKEVAAVWQEIYDNLSRRCATEFTNTYVGMEDNMPFFRQVCEDDKCYLEFECCPGEWIRLGNADQIPASSTPGGTPTPAAGGGVVSDCKQFNANSVLLLAGVFNAGDIITLSSANGSGYDGAGTRWYCPDGSQDFISCIPGTEFTSMTDPLNTASHMSLIAHINGAFYPIDVGNPLTVPIGTVNQQIWLQVNDDDLTDNFGSYTICFSLQNNQPLPPTTWKKDFLSGFGNGNPTGLHWTAFVYDTATATYDPATDAWLGGLETTSPGENDKGLGIKLTIPTGSTITRVIAKVKIQQTNGTVGTLAEIITIGGTTEGSYTLPADNALHDFVIDTGVISIDGSAEIDIKLDARGLVAAGDVTMILYAIEIQGTNTNPF